MTTINELTPDIIVAALEAADTHCFIGDFSDGKTIIDGCFDLKAVAAELSNRLKESTN